MNAQERNEKIELYGRGFSLLKAALAEVPQEAMKFKPAPTEWSVYEIIIHIADSESNAALRARKLIVEPGGTLMGYDQDAWANTLHYHDPILKTRWKQQGLSARQHMNFSNDSPTRCSRMRSSIPNTTSPTPSRNGSIFIRRISLVTLSRSRII